MLRLRLGYAYLLYFTGLRRTLIQVCYPLRKKKWPRTVEVEAEAEVEAEGEAERAVHFAVLRPFRNPCE